MKTIDERASELYNQAMPIFMAFEEEALVLFSMNKKVPDVELSEVRGILERFRDVLYQVPSGSQFKNAPEHASDLQLDVLTKLFSMRIQDIGRSVGELMEFARTVGEMDWAEENARQLYAEIIYHVSCVGAINSRRGSAEITPGAITEMYFDNEVTIGKAFISQDDAVANFLKRAQGSNLAPFAGGILAFANIAEDFIFRTHHAIDSATGPDVVDSDAEFRAGSLRDMLEYSGDVPAEFWAAYFECVYGLDLGGIDDLVLQPGTYEWAQERKLLPLYGQLSEQYPGFIDALTLSAEFQNPGAVISSLINARSSASPDLSL